MRERTRTIIDTIPKQRAQVLASMKLLND